MLNLRRFNRWNLRTRIDLLGSFTVPVRIVDQVHYEITKPENDPNGDVRQAVVAGKAAVGLLASDEAAKAAASAARVSVEYPNQGSIGTFVWPTALSRPKDARHPEAAAQLAERLASRDIEQLLIARVPGYLPLRAGIPVPPGVTSAANLVVVSVDPARIVAEIARRKAELLAWTESSRREQP